MKTTALVITIMCLFLSSCEVQNNNTSTCTDTDTQTEIVFAPSTVSVCHNPNSKNHHKICTPDCYEVGSTTAYCYDLPTDICNEDWEREPWVDDICKEIIESLQ